GLSNLISQVRSQNLVSIQQQDPIILDRKRIESPLPFLRPAACIMKLHHLCAKRMGNLDGFVGALRINDIDFGAETGRFQTPTDMARLIPGRNDDGNRNAVWQRRLRSSSRNFCTLLHFSVLMTCIRVLEGRTDHAGWPARAGTREDAFCVLSHCPSVTSAHTRDHAGPSGSSSKSLRTTSIPAGSSSPEPRKKRRFSSIISRRGPTSQAPNGSTNPRLGCCTCDLVYRSAQIFRRRYFNGALRGSSTSPGKRKAHSTRSRSRKGTRISREFAMPNTSLSRSRMFCR